MTNYDDWPELRMRLSPELHEWLKSRAKASFRTMGQHVRVILNGIKTAGEERERRLQEQLEKQAEEIHEHNRSN